MKTQDITKELWKDMENRKTKIQEKVYNWMQRDNLNAVILYGDAFWFELTCPSTNTMPDYVYEYLRKWGKSKGYRYYTESEATK